MEQKPAVKELDEAMDNNLDAALGDIVEQHGVRYTMGVLARKIWHLREFATHG